MAFLFCAAVGIPVLGGLDLFMQPDQAAIKFSKGELRTAKMDGLKGHWAWIPEDASKDARNGFSCPASRVYARTGTSTTYAPSCTRALMGLDGREILLGYVQRTRHGATFNIIVSMRDIASGSQVFTPNEALDPMRRAFRLLALIWTAFAAAGLLLYLALTKLLPRIS